MGSVAAPPASPTAANATLPTGSVVVADNKSSGAAVSTAAAQPTATAGDTVAVLHDKVATKTAETNPTPLAVTTTSPTGASTSEVWGKDSKEARNHSWFSAPPPHADALKVAAATPHGAQDTTAVAPAKPAVQPVAVEIAAAKSGPDVRLNATNVVSPTNATPKAATTTKAIVNNTNASAKNMAEEKEVEELPMAKLLIGDDDDTSKASASSATSNTSSNNSGAPIILNTTSANASIQTAAGAAAKDAAPDSHRASSTSSRATGNLTKTAAREATIAKQAKAAAKAAKAAEAKAERLEEEVAALKNKLAKDEQTISASKATTEAATAVAAVPTSVAAASPVVIVVPDAATAASARVVRDANGTRVEMSINGTSEAVNIPTLKVEAAHNDSSAQVVAVSTSKPPASELTGSHGVHGEPKPSAELQSAQHHHQAPAATAATGTKHGTSVHHAAFEQQSDKEADGLKSSRGPALSANAARKLEIYAARSGHSGSPGHHKATHAHRSRHHEATHHVAASQKDEAPMRAEDRGPPARQAGEHAAHHVASAEQDEAAAAPADPANEQAREDAVAQPAKEHQRASAARQKLHGRHHAKDHKHDEAPTHAKAATAALAEEPSVKPMHHMPHLANRHPSAVYRAYHESVYHDSRAAVLGHHRARLPPAIFPPPAAERPLHNARSIHAARFHAPPAAHVASVNTAEEEGGSSLKHRPATDAAETEDGPAIVAKHHAKGQAKFHAEPTTSAAPTDAAESEDEPAIVAKHHAKGHAKFHAEPTTSAAPTDAAESADEPAIVAKHHAKGHTKFHAEPTSAAPTDAAETEDEPAIVAKHHAKGHAKFHAEPTSAAPTDAAETEDEPAIVAKHHAKGHAKFHEAATTSAAPTDASESEDEPVTVALHDAKGHAEFHIATTTSIAVTDVAETDDDPVVVYDPVVVAKHHANGHAKLHVSPTTSAAPTDGAEAEDDPPTVAKHHAKGHAKFHEASTRSADATDAAEEEDDTQIVVAKHDAKRHAKFHEVPTASAVPADAAEAEDEPPIVAKHHAKGHAKFHAAPTTAAAPTDEQEAEDEPAIVAKHHAKGHAKFNMEPTTSAAPTDAAEAEDDLPIVAKHHAKGHAKLHASRTTNAAPTDAAEAEDDPPIVAKHHAKGHAKFHASLTTSTAPTDAADAEDEPVTVALHDAKGHAEFHIATTTSNAVTDVAETEDEPAIVAKHHTKGHAKLHVSPTTSAASTDEAEADDEPPIVAKHHAKGHAKFHEAPTTSADPTDAAEEEDEPVTVALHDAKGHAEFHMPPRRSVVATEAAGTEGEPAIVAKHRARPIKAPTTSAALTDATKTENRLAIAAKQYAEEHGKSQAVASTSAGPKDTVPARDELALAARHQPEVDHTRHAHSQKPAHLGPKQHAPAHSHHEPPPSRATRHNSALPSSTEVAIKEEKASKPPQERAREVLPGSTSDKVRPLRRNHTNVAEKRAPGKGHLGMAAVRAAMHVANEGSRYGSVHLPASRATALHDAVVAAINHKSIKASGKTGGQKGPINDYLSHKSEVEAALRSAPEDATTTSPPVHSHAPAHARVKVPLHHSPPAAEHPAHPRPRQHAASTTIGTTGAGPSASAGVKASGRGAEKQMEVVSLSPDSFNNLEGNARTPQNAQAPTLETRASRARAAIKQTDVAAASGSERPARPRDVNQVPPASPEATTPHTGSLHTDKHEADHAPGSVPASSAPRVNSHAASSGKPRMPAQPNQKHHADTPARPPAAAEPLTAARAGHAVKELTAAPQVSSTATPVALSLDPMQAEGKRPNGEDAVLVRIPLESQARNPHKKPRAAPASTMRIPHLHMPVPVNVAFPNSGRHHVHRVLHTPVLDEVQHVESAKGLSTLDTSSVADADATFMPALRKQSLMDGNEALVAPPNFPSAAAKAERPPAAKADDVTSASAPTPPGAAARSQLLSEQTEQSGPERSARAAFAAPTQDPSVRLGFPSYRGGSPEVEDQQGPQFPPLPASFEDDDSATPPPQPSNSAAPPAPATTTLPALQDSDSGGWFHSLFTWLWHAPAAQPKPNPQVTQKAKPALLPLKKQPTNENVHRWHTSFAAMDDRQRDISIADAFGRFEQQDEAVVKHLHSEDAAFRKAAKPTKLDAARIRQQPRAASTHISNFWKTLESEDNDMAQHLEEDKDLTKYEQLVHIQDNQVKDAAVQLERPRVQLRSGQHRAAPEQLAEPAQFVDSSLHDTFSDMEASDKVLEAKIHTSPDLQMMQLKDLHTKKTDLEATKKSH